MSKAISTLIIDMYGVILKDRTGNFISYTYEHFDSSEHDRIRNLLENDKLFTKAGLGEMTSHEFLSTLGYEDTEYHMKNYIENYLTFDPSFISFAEKFYKQYNFVLLSTDVSEWSRYITKFYGLDKYFRHKIVSGDVHCRKPNEKIYNITLQLIQAEANECLFIDDNINNILSAQKLGINSILYNRFNEQYTGEKVHSFEELEKALRHP